MESDNSDISANESNDFDGVIEKIEYRDENIVSSNVYVNNCCDNNNNCVNDDNNNNCVNDDNNNDTKSLNQEDVEIINQEDMESMNQENCLDNGPEDSQEEGTYNTANENDEDNENNNNLFRLSFNEEVLNESVESKHNEIMSWAYSNTMNVEDDIIKFIDYCYLKNLQYDDEPIDTIRYTIRTVFSEGIEYELNILISNIFSYAMIGINYVFNENFDILNELLSSELKRLLRRDMIINTFSQMLMNPNREFGPMEDIKLILTKEELDKIPVNIYKDISFELKEKNDYCPVCREEYHDNDNVRTLCCGHVFHSECVDNWLTNHSHKCPCCRQTTGNYKPDI